MIAHQLMRSIMSTIPCSASGRLLSSLSRKILLWKGTGKPGLSPECRLLWDAYETGGKRLAGTDDGSDTLMIGGSL